MTRAVFEKWLVWATTKFDQKHISNDLKMQIGKNAGRFGFAPNDMVSRQDVRDRLQKQMDVIFTSLSAADAERLAAAIHPIWFPA